MLFTSAVSAVFDQAFIPLSKNPLFTYLYVTVCIIASIAAIIFWLLFKHYNYEEDEMNSLDKTSTNRPQPQNGETSEV
jgi:proton-dependent oligopeptide transporter, POT family